MEMSIKFNFDKERYEEVLALVPTLEEDGELVLGEFSINKKNFEVRFLGSSPKEFFVFRKGDTSGWWVHRQPIGYCLERSLILMIYGNLDVVLMGGERDEAYFE